MNPILTTAALTITLAAGTVRASVITYNFAGVTNVGGVPRQFTGVFEYEDSVVAHTVYFPGDPAPVQQGFRSSYFNSIRRLSIVLDNGESVTSSPTGSIDVNNIQQAEPGAQVPFGLSVQAWAGPSTGTINGLEVRSLYLAFLPIEPDFRWDRLDDYFGGNAEAILQDDPGRLPIGIDPVLTGTTLNPSIEALSSGLFLGTVHGSTTTVNMITSFQRVVGHPCPADFNLDGAVDFFDYDDFVLCFEGVACPAGRDADFNEDGSVDFFDYDDFVAAFNRPC
jgi:hypothetical protein